MNKLIVVAAAVTALAAAPAAHAAAGFKAKRMTLSVELTGIHVVDWHVQDPNYPDPLTSWVVGKGTQTLGFSTRRPVRFKATAFSGRVPGGQSLPALVLQPQAAPRPLKGSLRRKGSWKYNDDSICDREGGCDDSVLVPPVHLPASCPARTVQVPAVVDVSASGGNPASQMLFAKFNGPLQLDGLWSNCPPDMDAVKRPLALAQPPATLSFGRGAKRVARMRRGSTLTLKTQVERGATDGVISGSCPKLAGPGQQECAVTDLTLEIKRVR